MKQYFIIFFALLTATAVVLMGLTIQGYRSVVPPSNDDYSDWAGPHILIDWQGIALLVAGIAVVSFIVWFVFRKQKQKPKEDTTGGKPDTEMFR